MAASTGVCKNDNKHHTQGVKGSLEEGVEVKAEIAAEITEEKKLAEVTLYVSLELPLEMSRTFTNLSLG